jgi:hypothetical protein
MADHSNRLTSKQMVSFVTNGTPFEQLYPSPSAIDQILRSPAFEPCLKLFERWLKFIANSFEYQQPSGI